MTENGDLTLGFRGTDSIGRRRFVGRKRKSKHRVARRVADVDLITSGSNGIIEPQSAEGRVRMQPWHVRCFRRSAEPANGGS